MTAKNNQFLDILEQHKGILYKISNAYGNSAEDRQDLVQEMTLQIWRSFHRYDPRYRWSTFIYRIALNVGISFYRKQRRRWKTVALSDKMMEIADRNDQPVHEREMELLQEFIAQLGALDRALMILYLDETSTKEMSEVLGISETNVTSKISRIKKKIKQRFKQNRIL